MYAAPAVPVVLTIVFGLTGIVALVEYARVVAAPRSLAAPVEVRAAAVLHLLMSVAMIAMAWGLVGGPGTASGTIQLAVFGVFALGFGVAASVPAAPRLSRSFHALTALAMVWMVAAMPSLMGPSLMGPSLMGSTGATDGGAGHDMAGMAGMDMGGASSPDIAPAGPAPTWVLGLTGVLVAVLAVVAVLWLVAAVRAPARVALATMLPRGTRCSPSQWACCHVLMSGGMAAMFATML